MRSRNIPTLGTFRTQSQLRTDTIRTYHDECTAEMDEETALVSILTATAAAAAASSTSV
jgi:hypothetical protein